MPSLPPHTTFAVTDFHDLVRNDLGLPLTDAQFATTFDELPEWDSLFLLKLVVLLERATAQPVPVSRLFEARSLQEIYDRVVTP